MEPLRAGIYRIHDEKNKVSFIGYTYNLRGILKRFRFELNMNACILKPLQIMFNESGKKAVLEEVCELDIQNMSEIEADAHLKAAMYKWQEQFEGDGETVKIILL